jgi:predicted AAA+ superfamily ATPase
MIFKRNIKENIEKALNRSPVVLLTGPRQAGKTVLMKEITEEKGYAYVSLDQIQTLMLARDNPVGFINNIKKPVIIDEVQRAPELFLAIKNNVDENRVAGQFALTGSANPLLIPKLGDSLAGRMEIFYLYPFSQGELLGRKEQLIDRLFARQIYEITPEKTTQIEIYDRMIKGGFPLVQSTDEEGRGAWFAGYVTTLVERDVKDLSNITDLVDFPKLLNIIAARTSGLLNFADFGRESSLVTMTLRRYMTLLQTLYFIQLNNPWFSNLGLRFVKAPKVYFTDTGLLSYVLDVALQRLTNDQNLSGKIFENFVVSELRKQATWNKSRVTMYHFRDHAGAEVDVVLENPQGNIVALEIKNTETVTPRDFKALKLLKEKMGEKFIIGVVVYQGSEIVPSGDNLFAMPVTALWS